MDELPSEDDALALLIAERDVLQTLHRYSHTYDYELVDEFVRVFTDDAVFEVVRALDGAPVHREEGAEELRRYIENPMMGPLKPPFYRKHIVVDPVIDVRGDEAFAESYFIHITRDAAGHQVRSFGRYKDVLRKVDGQWRIAKRLAEVESAAGDGESAR